MSAHSTRWERGAFLLLLSVALAGGGDPASRASDAWRHGGGAFLALWAALALLVAAPLALLELGRANAAGPALPIALGGARRAWVGWTALGLGALIASARLARLGALFGGGLVGAALILALVGVALGAAARPRTLGPLAALALGLVGVGSGLALLSGGAAGLALLDPRPEALLRPESWSAAVGAALASAPLIGLVAGLAPRAPERGRPGSQLVLALILATGLAQIGAIGAFGVLFEASTLPATAPPVGADAGLWTAAGEGAGGLGLALAALGGTLGLLIGLAVALREAAALAWPGAGARLARDLLLVLGGLAVAMGGGAAGRLAAELGGAWLGGVGLPLVALLVALAARAPATLLSAARAADASGALRLVAWSPALLRWFVPGALLLALAGGLLGRLSSPPGEEAALALGPLGPLTGALHVVGPALALVLWVAWSSGLALAQARPGPSRGSP